jgi:hypothetical protein
MVHNMRAPVLGGPVRRVAQVHCIGQRTLAQGNDCDFISSSIRLESTPHSGSRRSVRLVLTSESNFFFRASQTANRTR